VNAVERMRMCLAEAGYPDVFVGDDGDDPWVPMECEAPPEVRWRAFTLSVSGVPCLACWTWNHSGREAPCLAVDRLCEDCGVDREAG
jgi:hypothetical protein